MFAGLFATIGSLNATIIRVDNSSGNPGQYTTAQAAHNAALAGDTLYFNGSSVTYGNLTMTKKLALFGPGYFLGQNPQTQANLNTATLASVIIRSSASGSFVSGFSINNVEITDTATNIFIKRNYIYTPSTYSSIYIKALASNIFIEQNFILCSNDNLRNNIRILTGCSNIEVNNNIIEAQSYVNLGSGYALYGAIVTSSGLNMNGNSVYGDMNLSNSNITNHIWFNGAWGGNSNNSVTYSLTTSSNGSQFDTSNGNPNKNKRNVTSTSLFKGTATMSTDRYYELAVSSPAKGAGHNGSVAIDMGPYGGSTPYIASGLPAIPAIYFFSAPSSGSASTGLPVTIKVKSRR